MARKLRDHPKRDKSADGLGNRAQAYLLSHFPRFWRLVMAIGPIRRLANGWIINTAVRRGRSRPSPYGSMAVHGDTANPMAGYTSWELMTDTTWFKRHLPASTLGQDGDPRGSLPTPSELEKLYRVAPNEETLSESSTVLFLSFAQWFTDGFLMTDPSDSRKTHASHHIDLNPLYGLTRAESDAVRTRSEAPREKGKLKTVVDPDTGETFAPALFGVDGQIKPEFADLRQPLRLGEHLTRVGPERAAEIRPTIFAFAGVRANITAYTAMLNTLFLREHNRLADLIAGTYSDWDDERVFQTARNVNIVQLIKIVIEEYINHISPYHFQLSADPTVCWHRSWNKPNWIPIEFNLLYRWHSLTPAHFDIAGKLVPGEQIAFDNSHLINIGLGRAMHCASSQPSWNVGLRNTADFLVQVELTSVQHGRIHRLASYNDYREATGYGRVRTFEQITGDPYRLGLLKELYDDDVDKVEFFVGLFAEDISPRAALPPLMGRMVALDAFSQALTNRCFRSMPSTLAPFRKWAGRKFRRLRVCSTYSIAISATTGANTSRP